MSTYTAFHLTEALKQLRAAEREEENRQPCTGLHCTPPCLSKIRQAIAAVEEAVRFGNMAVGRR